MPGKQNQGPWYRHAEEWIEKGERYLQELAAGHGVLRLIRAESENHFHLQTARLIFESNRIEHAGLSEGETRRLVGAQDFEPARLLEYSGLLKYRDRPAYRLKGRTRGEIEVLRHLLTFEECYTWALGWRLQGKLPSGRGTERPVLDEGILRKLHADLGQGLIPADAGVPAGEYRTDRRTVEGSDYAFPAPELIPACMAKFVEQANELLSSDQPACEVAAKVSYEFVRIHPFPDFNGRLSRLLLNLVMTARGLPFPLVLKGDKRGKQRYFRSLKFANQGDLSAYASLIAMRLVESCEAIDANLERAGIETLRSRAGIEPGD